MPLNLRVDANMIASMTLPVLAAARGELVRESAAVEAEIAGLKRERWDAFKRRAVDDRESPATLCEADNRITSLETRREHCRVGLCRSRRHAIDSTTNNNTTDCGG
jgi:hypothetical protein